MGNSEEMFREDETLNKMTQKIVINNIHGGFGVSRNAFLLLRKLGNKTALEEPDIGEKYNDGSGPRTIYGSIGSFCCDIKRDDPNLIRVITTLGENSFGEHAELKIVVIPDKIKWQIEEYDGLEWVAEKHRTWRQ